MSLPYERLSTAKKEIRVLRVQAAQQAGRISATSHVISLEAECEPFNAISWCWGDASLRKSVLIDGVLIDVPARAVEVLQAVSLDGSRTDRPIWLDAICINQLDVKERAQQVAIMKDVYSRAENVFAWIGHASDDEEDVKIAIGAIIQQCRDNVDDLGELDRPVLRDPRILHRRGFSYDLLPTTCNWSAISRFYSAELFSRLWIVQEISLARKPTCLLGNTCVPWVDVGLAAEWMMHRNYERPEYCGMYLQGIVNCSIISHFRARVSTVDGILTCSTQFKTTEPRDKIYGLLGLIQREVGDNTGRTQPDFLSVDYKLPVATVYTMATRMMIEMTGRLNVLRFPELNPEFASVCGLVEDCPSWVPQFNASSTMRTKGVRNLGSTGCDNDQKLVLDSSTPREILKVKGVVVSAVMRIIGVLTDDILNDLSRLFTFIFEIFHAQACFNGSADPFDALYRVLTARNGDTSYRAAVLRSSFNTLIDECWRTWPKLIGPSPVNCDNVIPSSVYIDALRITNRYKSYFLAGDGRVGTGCSETAIGDRICILFGNRMPFLLRPDLKGEMIVNNIFVSEIMEVMRWVSSLLWRTLLTYCRANSSETSKQSDS